MLIAPKDARQVYDKLRIDVPREAGPVALLNGSDRELVKTSRAAKIRRLGRQLEKLWPAPRPVRPRPKKKGSSSRGADSLPPAQTVTPAAVELGAGTTSDPTPVASGASGGSTLTPAGEGQEPAPSTPHGRRPGEYVDTLKVVAWLNATGHRMRWLAKQLDVSKAHMQNCLLGFSKLSHARARKLDAIVAVPPGGAVS